MVYIVNIVYVKYYIYLLHKTKETILNSFMELYMNIIRRKTIELYSRVEHTCKNYKFFKVIEFEKSLHDVLIINLRLDDDFFEIFK